QIRDRRTGFVSPLTDVVLVLNARPTALVSGDATICNGQSAVVQALLTGAAPWKVTWASNGVNLGVSNVLASPATLTVSPVDPFPNRTNAVTYTVTALSDANSCESFPTNISGSATIIINPRPTASVTGTNTICNGDSTILSADLTGIGPWTVRWSDGFEQTTNTSPGSSVTATRSVNPANLLPNYPTNFLYTVTAVSNATTCVANPGDLNGGALITVN